MSTCRTAPDGHDQRLFPRPPHAPYCGARRCPTRLTGRGAVATVLVAAVVFPYASYRSGGGMPFVEDIRSMATVALVLGLAAFAVVGPRTALGALAGFVSLGLGIAAVWVETSEALLGLFVASIVGVWAAQVAADRGGPGRNIPKPG